MSLDLTKDHQHIACEKCETVWCAVCVARIDVKISPQWLTEQRARHVAQLN
jgi:hypothetical protein